MHRKTCKQCSNVCGRGTHTDKVDIHTRSRPPSGSTFVETAGDDKEDYFLVALICMCLLARTLEGTKVPSCARSKLSTHNIPAAASKQTNNRSVREVIVLAEATHRRLCRPSGASQDLRHDPCAIATHVLQTQAVQRTKLFWPFKMLTACVLSQTILPCCNFLCPSPRARVQTYCMQQLRPLPKPSWRVDIHPLFVVIHIQFPCAALGEAPHCSCHFSLPCVVLDKGERLPMPVATKKGRITTNVDANKWPECVFSASTKRQIRPLVENMVQAIA